jgi:hypothetical protein
MAKYQLFDTGLVTTLDIPNQPVFPFFGVNWKVDIFPERRRPNHLYNGKDVKLLAPSWESAQNALNLIFGCIHLINESPFYSPGEFIAFNEKEPPFLSEEDRHIRRQQYYSSTDIALACKIAAKASRNLVWTYAIEKYMYSISTYYVHHMDLEPHYSHHFPKSMLRSDHIIFCHAIISAFSAIEELGLNVPAGPNKPSRINSQWNPVVKDELESTLRKAGINLDETFLWIARGSKRNIEIVRSIPELNKARWASGMVRDCNIHLIDAIAYAEWLRDRVSSHKCSRLTFSLSPYEVKNVQDVARRLILESLGYWRWHYKKKKELFGKIADDIYKAP